MKEMISHEDLLERLAYDEESGVFTWKVRRGRKAYPGAVAGSLESLGYRQIGTSGRLYMAHRLAWFYVHKSWPEREIDHINGNRDDNRICNLREASRGENTRNSAIRKDSTTGVKGVSLHRGRYIARIRINGKRIHIGCFSCLSDAEAAVRSARTRMHAEFTKHG